MHDVIVVGAGPAGSYAAYWCSTLGLDTLLLEKETLPRKKACGGVTSRTLESFCGKDILDIAECQAIGNRLFYDYREIGFQDKEKLFFKRDRLDYFITEMASIAGCEIRDGEGVQSISVEEDRAVVATEEREYSSHILIGGDGAYSMVGKSVGLVNDRKRFYAAICAEVDTSKPGNDEMREFGGCDHQHTHFFSDLLGFAWLIPKRTSVNIGMGALMEKSLDIKDKFEAFIGHFGVDRDIRTRGHLIPYRPLHRVYSERVLLVGDAGGFVNPWNGCGIDLGGCVQDGDRREQLQQAIPIEV
jgi:geranylgeranyl reductase family protein